MIGGKQFAKGVGKEPVFGAMSWGPNAASDPVISGASSTLAGSLAAWVSSITYSATGVHTIVFKEGFTFGSTPVFNAAPQPASLTEYFHADVVGAYSQTTRTLVVTTHRAGTGRQVPADANARITLIVIAQDTGS